MPNWRETLMLLVAAKGTDRYPLLVFRVDPPSGSAWPAGLPSNAAIRNFFAICDGGVISLQYNFFRLGELRAQNVQWQKDLHDYRGDGRSVLSPETHLVIGCDSGGGGLIWDATKDSVSTFYARGGDWEPLDHTFEDFMQALFFKPESVGASTDMWPEALNQLRDT